MRGTPSDGAHAAAMPPFSPRAPSILFFRLARGDEGMPGRYGGAAGRRGVVAPQGRGKSISAPVPAPRRARFHVSRKKACIGLSCSTIMTLDPAPPACYAKRADSDAGSSVPRAAVGSDSLARFRGCIKGASRRAPRGHCPSLALHMGYVPLALRVARVTSCHSYYTMILLIHPGKLPYLNWCISQIFRWRFSCGHCIL